MKNNFLKIRTSLIGCWIVALLAVSPAVLAAKKPKAAVKPAPKPSPDVLVFTNGDKLTGALDHEENGTVFFKSDNAGMVQVPWTKLKQLTTTGPFAVIEDGTVVARKRRNADVPIGTVAVDGGMLTVTTAAGTQQIPVKNIAYLVDEATFEKNVRQRQGFFQGITGTMSAGASTVTSTQNSESVNTNIALARGVPAVDWMPPRQRTLLNFNNSYGRITQPNTPTVKTNILHAAIEQHQYFSPRFYTLEQAVFDHNYSQGLNLQQLYGMGVGYTVLKNPVQELDVTAVVNYTRQQFDSVTPPVEPTQNLIGSNFGDNYMRKLPKGVVFTEVASFTPAWNELQDYSTNVALGATFPVFKNFGFSVGFIDTYLNVPPTGFQGNTVQFTTGLTYSLR
jgi:hypothetical protein